MAELSFKKFIKTLIGLYYYKKKNSGYGQIKLLYLLL